MSVLFYFAGLHADWIVAALFAAMLLTAAVLVAWPVLRSRGARPLGKAVIATALVLFVVGLGGGAYLLIGTPELAARAFARPSAADVPGLVAELSRRMRDRPQDLTGWTLLGRGYLTLNDPSQAAIAFRHAAELAPAARRPDLLSSYGEALTLSTGSVTPEAEAAFDQALAGNPKDFAARFYLGEAAAARHNVSRARTLWASLLADAPPNAPWRADLIDRMAALQMNAGSAPDIGAMVSRLAEHLKAQPGDFAGWQRLLRAYAVLGDNVHARMALLRARAAMAGHAEKLAALNREAHALQLEK